MAMRTSEQADRFADRYYLTQNAERLIAEAYRQLRQAGAIHAAARVGACRKSVQGAVRHASRLLNSPECPPKFQVRVHRRDRRPKWKRDLHATLRRTARQYRVPEELGG